MTPFRPTFGTSPPLHVGREQQIDAFVQALAEGPGSPGRATVCTVGRGVGKTAMLNAVEDVARQQVWIVISETATPGLVERLTADTFPSALRMIAGTARSGGSAAWVCPSLGEE